MTNSNCLEGVARRACVRQGALAEFHVPDSQNPAINTEEQRL